jgi:HD-like signal output (HDOD) protein
VIGLLHDIGRLIIYKELPEHARFILERARTQDRLLTEVEREVLGFTHGKLGGTLLRKWKLPVSLEKSVRFHHRPLGAQNKQEAAVVCMANVLANALEQGSSGERLVPKLAPEDWEALNIPMSTLTQTVAQLDYQVDEILQFFADE